MEKRAIAFLIFSLIVIFFDITYFFFVRNSVENYFLGGNSDVINALFERLYPRLLIEKHRFSADFFLSKTDQIFYRVNVVFIIILTCYYFKIEKHILGWLTASHAKPEQAQFLRIYYYGVSFIWTYDWFFIMQKQTNLTLFYEPFGIVKLFGLPYPNVFWAFILFFLLQISAFFCLLNVKKQYFAVLYVSLFILIQNFLFSFSKIDHTFTLWTYIGLLMPFLFYEEKKADKGQINFFVIKCMQITIYLSYFFAGVEKLSNSGLAWLNATYFDFFVGAQALGLIFQLSAVFFIFFPRLSPIFIVLGIFFHSAIYFFLEIGYWWNVFVACYPILLLKANAIK